MRFVREPGYREPDLDPAPRVFLHRSPVGNSWRVRADLPEALAAEIGALCRREPVLARPPQEAEAPQIRERLIALLGPHAAAPQEHRGPTYWLPEGLAAPATARRVRAENAEELLEPLFSGRLHSPAGWERGGLAASVENGRAVALCFNARLTEHVAEAGVETDAAYQGRGHARAAVAAWAEFTRDSGRLPLYSTSWDHVVSRRVAAALSAVLYGEDWSLF